MPNPPNFNPGTGALVTSRYDFQNHINGTAFRHTATEIDVSPSLDGYTTVDSALRGLQSEISQLSSSVVLNGNVTGLSGSNTVIKINGATVPVAGSLVAGTVLQATGTSSLGYGPVNLSTAATGTLPTANQAQQSMVGDVSGTTGSNTVVSISGSSGTATINATTVQWATLVTTPTITQAIASSGNGAPLLVQAQSGAIGIHNGGDLQLSSGNGGGTPGKVTFQVGGTSLLYVINTSIGVNPSLLEWDAAVISPTLTQVSTSSATAQNLIFTAQQSTNGSGTGGSINLNSGTGTTSFGSINLNLGSSGTYSFVPTNLSNKNTQLGVFKQAMTYANTVSNSVSVLYQSSFTAANHSFNFEITWVARQTASVLNSAFGKTIIYGYYNGTSITVLSTVSIYNSDTGHTIAATTPVTLTSSGGSYSINANGASGTSSTDWQALIVGIIN